MRWMFSILTGQHQEWMAEKMLEHGMPVEPDNYAALYVCVNNQAADIAKLLLDKGIDGSVPGMGGEAEKERGIRGDNGGADRILVGTAKRA